MGGKDYKDVLVANSPLPSSILAQVIGGTPQMGPADLNAVLAANGM